MSGTLMKRPPLNDETELIADITGVGMPVAERLEDADLDPIACTITAGDAVIKESRHYRIPKRDLVSTLQILLQDKRLQVAEALAEASTLVKELTAFKTKIAPVPSDTMIAWREGIHDDLVFAVAIAVWYAEQHKPFRFNLDPAAFNVGLRLSPWNF